MEHSNYPAHYRDGYLYDLAYSQMVGDIPFYLGQARACGGPVLEIACGTGRIAIPLAKAGLDVTGLDVSEEMLTRARQKADTSGVKIGWVRADCRDFELNRKFRLILMPFNSLQHLYDRESLEHCLTRIRGHLETGGTFVFDVFNPDLLILTRDPGKRFPVNRFVHPETGEEVVIEERNRYDSATQLNHIAWYYSIGGKKDAVVEEFAMRCFYPQELDELLYANGFHVQEKFGTFQGKPFGSGDPKQILLCHLL